jgi:hypothetical protein
MAAKAKSKRKSLKTKDLPSRGDRTRKVRGGAVGPCFGKGKKAGN